MYSDGGEDPSEQNHNMRNDMLRTIAVCTKMYFCCQASFFSALICANLSLLHPRGCRLESASTISEINNSYKSSLFVLETGVGQEEWNLTTAVKASLLNVHFYLQPALKGRWCCRVMHMGRKQKLIFSLTCFILIIWLWKLAPVCPTCADECFLTFCHRWLSVFDCVTAWRWCVAVHRLRMLISISH